MHTPLLLRTVDYGRTEPCMVAETLEWAVVYKPPLLPTAPLRADERNTLVYWFLHARFDTRPPIPPESEAQAVRGKKAIEAGVLHRLDTDTRGVVLFAKDQKTYDFLATRQKEGKIVKTYYAFVETALPAVSDAPRLTSACTAEILNASETKHASALPDRIAAQLPYRVASQFRSFGPGAKRVAPVFPPSRHYKKEGRLYTTIIESLEAYPPLSETGIAAPLMKVRCRLSLGYRHQVRVHLASCGLPIVGDPLYASGAAPMSYSAPKPYSGLKACNGLQLYAVSLMFPDPENPRQNICVALQPPDKMNR